MGKDFKVTVYDPERKAEWEAVLGTATVSVLSPVPGYADVFGHPRVLVYELDVDALTEEQRRKLVAHLAEKFGFDEAEVEANLDEYGVPILAEDCVASIANLQR